MVLGTNVEKELGCRYRGLWTNGTYDPDQWFVVVGVATLADWLRQNWDAGGPVAPDLPPGADLDSAHFYHVELRADHLSMEEP